MKGDTEMSDYIDLDQITGEDSVFTDVIHDLPKHKVRADVLEKAQKNGTDLTFVDTHTWTDNELMPSAKRLTVVYIMLVLTAIYALFAAIVLHINVSTLVTLAVVLFGIFFYMVYKQRKAMTNMAMPPFDYLSKMIADALIFSGAVGKSDPDRMFRVGVGTPRTDRNIVSWYIWGPTLKVDALNKLQTNPDYFKWNNVVPYVSVEDTNNPHYQYVITLDYEDEI